jgi:hypothetical protein
MAAGILEWGGIDDHEQHEYGLHDTRHEYGLHDDKDVCGY